MGLFTNSIFMNSFFLNLFSLINSELVFKKDSTSDALITVSVCSIIFDSEQNGITE